MKKTYIRYCIFILTNIFSLAACVNNRDTSPRYTAAEPGDTIHSSGGLVNTSRGEAVFTQRCMACHGPLGNYRINNAADLQLTRLDSISIAATIRHGRGAMPMFSSDALPDSDLGQVELYVKTLRKF